MLGHLQNGCNSQAGASSSQEPGTPYSSSTPVADNPSTWSSSAAFLSAVQGVAAAQTDTHSDARVSSCGFTAML